MAGRARRKRLLSSALDRGLVVQVVRRTALEAFALLLLGCAVGLAGNGIRDKGLALTRNHFEVALVPTEAGSVPTEDRGAEEESTANPSVLVVTLDDVCICYHAADYRPGSSDNRYLFIDARDDACYCDGHIPGAVQLDHYYRDKYLSDILPLTENVEKVIIYCNGGNCEDSVLVSQDLLAEGVPADKVVLFKDGWETWVEAELPVETGGN